MWCIRLFFFKSKHKKFPVFFFAGSEKNHALFSETVSLYMYISPWIIFGFPIVPPRFFNNVSGEQVVKERSNLKLYCGASGEPAPNITWIRVFKNGSESEVLHTGATWNIVSINQTDAGNYSCIANNGVGSPVNHSISVNVLCKYALTCTLYLTYKNIFFIKTI